ncbi:hypothetical protein LIER_39810 [Lithospermum erythrorhizon]|uniref:Uncharacterized protein n=1 Tax=Lithospermum erythrorhizon TaxID=34254 RepID=A0AAV3QLC0_LITER
MKGLELELHLVRSRPFPGLDWDLLILRPNQLRLLADPNEYPVLELSGFGPTWAVRSLAGLVTSKNPRLVFLNKTKLWKDEWDHIMRSSRSQMLFWSMQRVVKGDWPCYSQELYVLNLNLSPHIILKLLFRMSIWKHGTLLNFMVIISVATKALATVLAKEIDRLREAYELYWSKRSRITWRMKGNRNTAFFHVVSAERGKKTLITVLQDNMGGWYREFPQVQ